jgi:hypothetical protein
MPRPIFGEGVRQINGYDHPARVSGGPAKGWAFRRPTESHAQTPSKDALALHLLRPVAASLAAVVLALGPSGQARPEGEPAQNLPKSASPAPRRPEGRGSWSPTTTTGSSPGSPRSAVRSRRPLALRPSCRRIMRYPSGVVHERAAADSRVARRAEATRPRQRTPAQRYETLRPRQRTPLRISR